MIDGQKVEERLELQNAGEKKKTENEDISDFSYFSYFFFVQPMFESTIFYVKYNWWSFLSLYTEHIINSKVASK